MEFWAQRTISPFDGREGWTVVDNCYVEHVRVAEYLRSVLDRGGSVGTARTYAGRLALWLGWTSAGGLDESSPSVEQLAAFARWLERTPSRKHRRGRHRRRAEDTNVVTFQSTRSPATVDGIVAAVVEFIRFGVSRQWCEPAVAGRLSSRVELRFIPAGLDRGEQTNLPVVQRRAVRRRRVERPPATLTAGQVGLVVDACVNVRDRFIVEALYATGVRVSELCGLHLADLHLLPSAAHLGCQVAGAHLHVVRREDNENRALAKSIWPRVLPVTRALVRCHNAHQANRQNCTAPPSPGPTSVFGLKLHRLGQEGTRALVVVVPASVDGPHLIYRGEYFGAPIRNDADTVWMKERQIEATYFARFEERRFGSEALDGLYDDVLAGRDIDERAWLIAVARPRLSDPVRQRMQRDQARQLLGQAPPWALTFAGRGCIHPLENVDLLNPRPGLRRWVAPNTATSESQRWREAWMSVHDDGSVTLATAIGGHRGSEGTLPGNRISSSSVEGAVADLMGLLRVMADQHGGGDYQVRIGIEWAGAERLVMETVDTFGGRFDGGSIPLARVTPVRSTVRTDVDSFEFVHQVRDLALDLVNQGGIENLTQITKPQTHEI